jgi:hypothetical protein
MHPVAVTTTSTCSVARATCIDGAGDGSEAFSQADGACATSPIPMAPRAGSSTSTIGANGSECGGGSAGFPSNIRSPPLVSCVATNVTPRVTEILIKFLKLQLSPNARLNQATKVWNQIQRQRIKISSFV